MVICSALSLRCFLGDARRFRPAPRTGFSQRPRGVTTVRTARRLRIRAETGSPSSEPEKETELQPPDDEPTLAGKIFGSYLQLGVWIVVLSFAGYKGITIAQSDPSAVGLLLAPPAGALFLIVTFLIYRFWFNKDQD